MCEKNREFENTGGIALCDKSAETGLSTEIGEVDEDAVAAETAEGNETTEGADAAGNTENDKSSEINDSDEEKINFIEIFNSLYLNYTNEEKKRAAAEEKRKKEVEAIEKENLEKETERYNHAKAKLDQLENRKKNILFPFLYVVISGVTGVIFFLLLYHEKEMYINYNPTADIIISFLISVFTLCFLLLAHYLYIDFSESSYREIVLAFEAKYIQNEVEDDIFENSIKMSYKYLDRYYDQTRDQAQKGFFVTLCVAVAGALILAVGIISLYFGKTEPAYVTTASGVITEFIAAIFFYLYNKTVRSMGAYHNKLVLSQNVSIALKLCDSVSNEKKDDIKSEVVKELVKDINKHINEEEKEST